MAGDTNQVLGDVSLDNVGQLEGGSEDGSPAHKSRDIIFDELAVLDSLRNAGGNETKFFEGSLPFFVSEITECLLGTDESSLGISDALFKVGETFFLDDSVNNTDKHGVVLVGGQIADVWHSDHDELVEGCVCAKLVHNHGLNHFHLLFFCFI